MDITSYAHDNNPYCKYNWCQYNVNVMLIRYQCNVIVSNINIVLPQRVMYGFDRAIFERCEQIVALCNYSFCVTFNCNARIYMCLYHV